MTPRYNYEVQKSVKYAIIHGCLLGLGHVFSLTMPSTSTMEYSTCLGWILFFLGLTSYTQISIDH